MGKTLMVLDGNSIVNRAYYGIHMLNAPDGTPTNGVYGFVAILERLLELESPDGVCVAFDVHAPTFRHEMSDAYKATRKPMPEDLQTQIPILKELLDAMGIRRYELAGWEADDLLGTIAASCQGAGWDCRLVTGDKDAFQLITDTTHVVHIKTRQGQTETIEYDPARFREEYGFEPSRMVDLKALMGDSSDNIPGVPGIGEKSALALLRQFGTLDGVYENLEDASIKPGQRKKLTEGEASARLSYTLATIRRDAPVEFAPEENLWSLKPDGALYDICSRLGFGRFIKKWGLEPGGEDAAEAQPEALPHKEYTGQELFAVLESATYIAVWPEDGLDVLSLCDGEAVFQVSWTQAGLDYNCFLKTLFSAGVKKLGHNVKELMSLLLADGLETEGFVFDTALAGYLLDATASDYALPKLSRQYLSQELDKAEAIYALYQVLPEKLKSLGMETLYYEIELPLCPVLANMERVGFLVDRKALYDFGQSLTEGITALQQEIWQQAGSEFNINSPKQLGEVLFERLGLPTGKKNHRGWSTSAEVLERLRDKRPIVGQALEYRELTKLKSTYTDGLMKTIGPDGRIHTTFQMTATDTGRLSSRDPNLQNIPIRRQLGSGIRRMFVAGPGNVLVDADYSQIELRLLANISGDETMTNAFLSGEDIHAVTASQVFGVPLEQVTSQLRSQAKAVNFGIVYGISAFSLADDIGVSNAEAKTYIDAYMAKYHGVREYMESVIQQGKEQGYVSTLFGRRRYLPELKASNFNVRSFGQRVARNMPIQGTAADIIKLAMIRVYDRLKKELPQARLLLQVHDELIVECPADMAERAAAILEEEMENVVHYPVPLTADTGTGASWADAH
ncbi:MAG: DNA polymerase I [Oscillospiraceae bacterium]|nr:DNA polymerase I [Oscillospiraceae bacterium]